MLVNDHKIYTNCGLIFAYISIIWLIETDVIKFKHFQNILLVSHHVKSKQDIGTHTRVII